MQLELQAQVDRALVAGIEVTHVDTHMGAVAHPRFAPAYIQTAWLYGLPAMMLRLDEAGWREMAMDGETAALAVQFARQLEARGLPLLDNLAALPLDSGWEDRIALARKEFDALPPGLTHLLIHPAQDTPELRAITPDWPSRVADYRAFGSEELKSYVERIGVQVIGYRPLRELVRFATS